MCRKNKNRNIPSERLSREQYYDAITASISSYIRITNKTKNIFQIVLGIITSLLVVSITIAFVILIVYILKYGQSWQLDSSTIITTIVTSSATYATSLIGTLSIVVKYMFNKNDIADHSKLLKSFLESNSMNDDPLMQEKSVGRMANETGITEYIADMNQNSKKDNKNG